MSTELGDKLAEIDRLEGFISGLYHARDFCNCDEYDIQDEIDKNKEQLKYLIDKL